MSFNFGSGFLYGVPATDANGAAVANPTPVQFAVLQDVSVDFGFENKMLYGQNQFPVAVGRGKGKISIKAKFAHLNGSNFNTMFFGQTLANNVVSAKNEITGKAIPATPFTLTASATTETATTFLMPGGATSVFSRDLGVKDASGAYYVRVASAPAAGQYTVSVAGAYVFAAADAAKVVYISYEYTSTLASAKQFTVLNNAMGYAPSFMAVLNSQYQGGFIHMRFPNCISGKLSIPTKNDDFTIPELEMDVFADSGGQVALLSFDQ